MKKFLFLILTISLFACSDDTSNIVEDAIYVDGYKKEKYLNEQIPQHILDKMMSDTPLSNEDKHESDEINLGNIHYKGNTYTIDELYDDRRLMEVYFGEETYTGVYDDQVFLFETLKELEDFGNNLEKNIEPLYADRNWWEGNFQWLYECRFYEHANYSGAQIHLWKHMTTGTENIGVVLPSNWWYRVSSSKTSVWNLSSLQVVNQKLTLIGLNSDRFYFNLVSGNSGQNYGWVNIKHYGNFQTFNPSSTGTSSNVDVIMGGGLESASGWGESTHSNQNDKLVAFTVSTFLASDNGDVGDFVSVLSQMASYTPDLAGATALLADLVNLIVSDQVDGEILSMSGGFKFRRPHTSRHLSKVGDDLKMRYTNQVSWANYNWFLVPGRLTNHPNFEGFHDFRSSDNLAVDQHTGNQSNVYLHTPHNGDNQKWMILKYKKWNWSRSEYKIMNAHTGKAIHWADNNDVYMDFANPTRDYHERFWMDVF